VGGFNLNDAFKKANSLDDEIGNNLRFAFDEKLGYLTACPTNLGTGLRASVMLHIPALCANNEISGVISSLQKIGMTIRGWHGEGSKALGNIFQISNQLTLGFTEEEILDNFKGVVNEIIIKELNIRERMKTNLRWEFDDKIFRALGILRNAILITKNEAIGLLSDVRFGLEMGTINNIEKRTLNRLLIEIQPSTLEKIFNSSFNSRERDFHRARLIKERLK
ncbi:MAG: ATP--guanido phosphotransferase, partial [Oscillospiraceae bacterium]|nr:ATP--guanido phosphotransferase [Oscillospiraceae bacterium]